MIETLQKNYNGLKEDLDKINNNIKNNKAKNQLDDYKEKLNIMKNNIENINNNVSMLNNEIEKIDISKLKKEVQEKINKTLNENIILV